MNTNEILKRFQECIPVNIVCTDLNQVRRESHKLDGQLNFRSYHLSNDMFSLGEVRCLSLESSKVSVVSFFYYPESDLSSPIFACEFVDISSKKMIVAVDAPSFELVNDQHLPAFLHKLFRSHFDLSQNNDMPDWYVDCASKNAVFWLSDNLSSLHEQIEQCISVWKKTIQYISTASLSNKCNDQQKHRSWLQEYKKHHCDHSPGLPIMKTLFGHSWTDEFMREVFFL